MTMTTGEYRAADVDDLRALARELDDAADEVARSSRAVRQAAASVCRDLGSVPDSLATTVFELRDRAHDLRARAARLVCAPEPERPGAVTFTIPPPEPEDDGGGWGHLTLDALGFVPLFGAVPDGINAAWYAAEGDATNAALSGAALIPLFGDAVSAPKFLGKSADEVGAVLRSGDEAFTLGDLRLNAMQPGTHVDRHVGKTVEQLRKRLATSSRNTVSTFADEAAAVRGIDAAIRANPDAVLAVVSRSSPYEGFSAAVDGLGTVVLRSGEVLPATHVQVYLKATDDGALVVTAFVEAL